MDRSPALSAGSFALDRNRLRVSRSRFLVAAAIASTAVRPGRAASTALPPWVPGTLEIHHISTGRGNATLVLAPDATAFLIDAGAAGGDARELAPARPDASRSPGEWIGRYVARRLASAGRAGLDAFVATHFHSDHLDGLADVAAVVPIARIVDRSAPMYRPTSGGTAAVLERYRSFLSSRHGNGIRVERAAVGSRGALRPRTALPATTFAVQVLAANGVVWNGRSTESFFPLVFERGTEPSENVYSIALLIEAGRFRYFTGGDLTCADDDGAAPWWDVESAVARGCGRVDVAAVDHHGYHDAAGPTWVRALAPQAFVIQAWHATHPALSTLERLFSPVLFSAPRDVFSTTLADASRIVNARLLPKMRGTSGHVVVRVSGNGDRFTIVIVNDEDELDEVLAVHGPYRCVGNDYEPLPQKRR